jgi:hypothetical protein
MRSILESFRLMCGAAAPRIPAEGGMRFREFSFGSIRIDRTTYEDDAVIDRDGIRKRKKNPSRQVSQE